MNREMSKTNHSRDFFDARLDEIRMSVQERLQAKAHIAQAEAVADALAGLFGLVRRVLKAAVARPLRRPTVSAG